MFHFVLKSNLFIPVYIYILKKIKEMVFGKYILPKIVNL